MSSQFGRNASASKAGTMNSPVETRLKCPNIIIATMPLAKFPPSVRKFVRKTVNKQTSRQSVKYRRLLSVVTKFKNSLSCLGINLPCGAAASAQSHFQLYMLQKGHFCRLAAVTLAATTAGFFFKTAAGFFVNTRLAAGFLRKRFCCCRLRAVERCRVIWTICNHNPNIFQQRTESTRTLEPICLSQNA